MNHVTPALERLRGAGVTMKENMDIIVLTLFSTSTLICHRTSVAYFDPVANEIEHLPVTGDGARGRES